MFGALLYLIVFAFWISGLVCGRRDFPRVSYLIDCSGAVYNSGSKGPEKA